MSEGIRPALTPEQWAWHDRTVSLQWDPDGPREHIWLKLEEDGTLKLENGAGEGTYSVDEIAPEARHGAAALCLYGQPFGFTWDDADTLRQIAMYYHEAANRGVDARHPLVSEVGADLENLAARIESLLPPRETKAEP